jgi:uncharacterized protein
MRQHNMGRAILCGADAVIGSALIGLIRAYRYLVSPLLGPQCRFYPSCSVYCEEAIRAHGCIKGPWLGLRRLCKCHPFHPGGLDPVPRSGGRL